MGLQLVWRNCGRADLWAYTPAGLWGRPKGGQYGRSRDQQGLGSRACERQDTSTQRPRWNRPACPWTLLHGRCIQVACGSVSLLSLNNLCGEHGCSCSAPKTTQHSQRPPEPWCDKSRNDSSHTTPFLKSHSPFLFSWKIMSLTKVVILFIPSGGSHSLLLPAEALRRLP